MVATKTLHAQGINFEEQLSWAQVKEKAAKQHKYIFVDCYTTWCAPCRMMDQQIYPAKEAGDAVNSKFIAVKVQMDRTSKDDDQVKSWYQDAALLDRKYAINAYPTILFLSPEGNLITRKVGATDVKGFVNVIADVLNPSKQFDFIATNYLSGKLKLQDYPFFADKAELLNKNGLADSVRRIFKIKYMDKLPLDKVLAKENLFFLYRHPDLVNSKDRYFKLCKTNAVMVDSILPGVSHDIVQAVLVRELIINKVFMVTSPDWVQIEKGFIDSYKFDDALDTFLLNKIQYYIRNGSLIEFANVVDELIDRSSNMLNNGFRLYGLNNFAWSHIFLKTNDPQLLAKAVDWINIVTAIDPVDEYIDTKANLLYKLGKKDVAIAIEQSIVNRRMASKPGKSEREAGGDFYLALQKMKNGEPTWINVQY